MVHVAGKRRHSRGLDIEVEAQEAVWSDDEGDPPLPSIQQRVSGRIRKRPRHGDDQFIEY